MMATVLPQHSSTPEEEMPRVLEALHAVFQSPTITNNQTPNAQAEGNQYLTSFQHTSVAWQVCDRLLTETANNQTQTQTNFFAAQTLHAKCRADVLQLGEGDLPGLRDSLMAHLLRFCNSANSSSVIVTRLAMALCALAVQMEWTSVLTDILGDIQSGQSSMEGGRIHLALEICQLLPEETTSHRLFPRRGENQRDCFLTVLRESSKTVLEFLGFCVSSLQRQHQHPTGCEEVNNLKIRESILRCLHSWIRNVAIPPVTLESSPLVDLAFQIINGGSVIDGGGDTFELAVDVVVELLRCYPSHVSNNMGLVRKMVPLLMGLSTPTPVATVLTTHQPSTSSGSSAFHTALATEDEDGMRAFCRIYTEMGEAYMSLIMSHENLNQVTLVELVLACSAIPDHDIANITLNFWYRFVTSIETISPYEYRQYQVDNFLPQLTRLVSTCTTTLLPYPPDMDTLPPDLLDEVHRHRSYVSDTLEDCCRLLGGAEVLKIVGESLKGECQRLQSGGAAALATQWHGVEACLFALIGASRYTPEDEGNVMPFAISILPNLLITAAANNNCNTSTTMVATPPLCNTINSLIGAYAPWLDRHTRQLKQILPLLSTTMADQRCASSASIAVRNLCESCRSPGSAQCLSGEICVQWYEEIVRGSLLEVLRDELEVLEGVCVAVTRYLKGAGGEVGVYLGRIMGPIGTRLAALTTGVQAVSATPRQIGAELERMTVIVRFLDVYDSNTSISTIAPSNNRENKDEKPSAARSQFLINLATQCWVFLEAASLRHPSDVYLAEKLCRLHKYLLRRCGAKPYRQQLQPLRVHLVGAYTRSHLSPYLYLASICIAEFSPPNPGDNEATASPTELADYTQCEAILLEMFQKLSETTFSFLRSVEDFRSHPDVMEELFFMASKMVQSCPRSFVGNFPLLHLYVQCALEGIHLDHKDANRGIMNFLETLVGYGLTLKESLEKGGIGIGVNGINGMAALVGCKDSLEKAVMAEGKNVVTKLLQALSGNLPRYRIIARGDSGSIAGILYKLNQLLSPGLLASWFTEALAIVEQASPLLEGGERNEISKLLESMTGVSLCQSDFFDSVCQFASMCDRKRRMGRR